MSSTLESSRDRSARRGWSTLASFGFQAMAVSLLLLIPLISIQGPPKLQWFEPPQILTPPPAPAPPASGERRSTPSTNLSGTHLMQPPTIPTTIAILNEQPVASAPNIDEGGVAGGTGTRRGVIGSIGPSVEVVCGLERQRQRAGRDGPPRRQNRTLSLVSQHPQGPSGNCDGISPIDESGCASAWNRPGCMVWMPPWPCRPTRASSSWWPIRGR